MNQKLDRRTMLRGLGTVMALPLLESMMPLTALAQSGAKAARPVRMGFIYIPNGAHMQAWTPAAEGALQLTPILEPLKNVKNSVNVLTGLAQLNARSFGEGGGSHARAAAAWLTGCHPSKKGIKNDISVDQLAAQYIGKQTRFASLEIGCDPTLQAGQCDTGWSCAYSSCISWRSATTAMAKENNPRLVFERLFGSNDPNETQESRARRALYNKSILDFVLDDADRLKKRLGITDQQKMDEYFSGVREIEQRLVSMEKQGIITPPNGAEIPTGIPDKFGGEEHIRLMGDMMVLAFQADLTRISTFMFANEGTYRTYPTLGINEAHHPLSHHGGQEDKQEKIQQINTYHMQQLAYILEKMQSIQEGDRTLLDNSMIVYGGGISDGDRHNIDNLPLLIAGGGGGTIRGGRHLRFADKTPMTNLFVSMLDRAGVPAEKIGDSTGPLKELI